MEVQINIDPKHVEQMVVNAIMQSAIGDEIAKQVDLAIGSLRGYDNPIQKAIRAKVQQIVSQVVNDEYGDKIREAVRAHLTDEVVGEVTGKAFQAFLDKM